MNSLLFHVLAVYNHLENWCYTPNLFFNEYVGSKLQADSQNWSPSNMTDIKYVIWNINWIIMN